RPPGRRAHLTKPPVDAAALAKPGGVLRAQDPFGAVRGADPTSSGGRRESRGYGHHRPGQMRPPQSLECRWNVAGIWTVRGEMRWRSPIGQYRRCATCSEKAILAACTGIDRDGWCALAC